MKTRIGIPLGLALTLVVGVFATMLALGLFTTTAVQAQTATAVDAGDLEFDPAETDVVAAVQVVFTATGGVAAGGAISIEFPATAVVPSKIANDAVTITVDGAPEDAAGVMPSGQTVTLTVTTAIDAADSVTVNFLNDEAIAADTDTNTAAVPEKKAGIRTPLEAGDHTVMVWTSTDMMPNESGADTLTLTSPAGKVSGVLVKHSPDGAGAAARVQVDFYIATALTADVGTITIEFNDDVQMPAVFSESSISIIGNSPRVAVNPADVFVRLVGNPADEPEITLTIPDFDARAEMVGGLTPGLVSVVFRQSAGIKNPTAAGTWPVKVETSNDSQAESEKARSRSLVTDATLSLNNTKGKRGSTATASGSGFKDGTTATVWLERNTPPNDTQDGGEPTLCTADIAKDDTFTCDFVIGAAFEPTNWIQVKDGQFTTAVAPQGWAVSSQVKAVPSSAAIGEKVTIQIRDYGTSKPANFMITLGGREVELESGYSYSDGSADITGTVPDTTALGVQTLQVIGGTLTAPKNGPNTKVTVLGARVEASPSTVVPNQSVTITGRGFSRNGKIIDPANSNAPTINHSQILIGGSPITDWSKINGGDPIDMDAGGSWVATIVIPVESPATAAGTYELRIIDHMGRPGVTSITVPARTVTFEPPESRVGSDVTVSGTGWVASNSASDASSDIELEYVSATGKSSARANPDSNGSFSTTIQVPRNAPIPSTNQVTVSYEVETSGGSPVSEQVSHRVPGAEVTITPSSGPGGTVATVTGAGFKAFTSLETIHIGETRVTPNPAGASVGRDGVLQSVTILIPALDPGTLSVKVNVSDSIANTAFTITDEDAPLATTAEDTTPDVAFKELIDSGSLLTVFWYNEDTQSYLSYDPDPANAGFNDLETVGSGDIFWVRLSEDANFLGKLRRAEWAQVVLP